MDDALEIDECYNVMTLCVTDVVIICVWLKKLKNKSVYVQ